MDPKPVQFTAVHRDSEVLHISPKGNSHTRCGRVALYAVNVEIAGRSFAAGTHRACKSCQKARLFVKTPIVVDEITDTWQITNKAGESLGRVTARDAQCAMRIARQDPTTARVFKREGGLSLRRMYTSQL